ncbi:MAG: CDP-alcohol phosphatidyltransferase family protein, partial [Candidatus Uhrbacteria bacterium]|nr:CDP-alcohol phosphatidyltransferase family protein [Candidatus Uhrbacteria bacterium]
ADYLFGVPLFVIAAFTDLVDGSLARVRNRITPWGIFFDPVADKLLIGSVALVVAIRYFHPAIVFTAIGLDLLPAVMFLGRVKPDGQIMMANVWGKSKMFLQFVSISSLLLGITLGMTGMVTAGEITLGVSLVFALVAAATYSL